MYAKVFIVRDDEPAALRARGSGWDEEVLNQPLVFVRVRFENSRLVVRSTWCRFFSGLRSGKTSRRRKIVSVQGVICVHRLGDGGQCPTTVKLRHGGTLSMRGIGQFSRDLVRGTRGRDMLTGFQYLAANGNRIDYILHFCF